MNDLLLKELRAKFAKVINELNFSIACRADDNGIEPWFFICIRHDGGYAHTRHRYHELTDDGIRVIAQTLIRNWAMHRYSKVWWAAEKPRTQFTADQSKGYMVINRFELETLIREIQEINTVDIVNRLMGLEVQPGDDVVLVKSKHQL